MRHGPLQRCLQCSQDARVQGADPKVMSLVEVESSRDGKVVVNHHHCVARGVEWTRVEVVAANLRVSYRLEWEVVEVEGACCDEPRRVLLARRRSA